MTHTEKPSPDTGKVSAELTEGAGWIRNGSYKKAAPAYFVKAVCCGAVTVFHHCCTKKLSFLSRW
ncbi:hypothetical protein HMPREF1250_1766 [Megasphaera vaginalis (ex Srinivasan et al. 2021)]|uniref:Uncharacterized protein n=1 Tax=Megasphaera vaginalis (ex Srinivasan et al. 2021) TaxID=1111454 RepID=U7UCI8_9FIRM|nr:hypothetical protein HMPREF1250_1766 [Megasphaera vaginalis (ex Srinivasan et al. 2021)]